MPVDPQLTIDVMKVGSRDVIALRGEVDLASAPRVGEELETLSVGEVVLDLRKVEFMDSSGLKRLVDQTSNFEEAGGALILIVEDGTLVMRLLDMTHLSDGFRIVNSIEDLRSP